MSIDYDQVTEEVIKTTLRQIDDDRQRAQHIFEELYAQLLAGNNDPELIAELNKAQENIQRTTENMVKLLGRLAQIRSGAFKLQIAQINTAKDSNQLVSGDRRALLEFLEESGINPLPDKISAETVEDDQ